MMLNSRAEVTSRSNACMYMFTKYATTSVATAKMRMGSFLKPTLPWRSILRMMKK